MYGATGAQLRTAMTQLLHQHRIQQRLGGPNLQTTATTTIAERADLGAQIRRYRQSILTWCVQATGAAQPTAFSNLPQRAAAPLRDNRHIHVALAELGRSLELARASSDAPLPGLRELTTPHPNATVEAWRRAAKAAALAEHDLAGPEATGRLSAAQAQVLIGDVAAIAQALVILDRRYRRVPGWQQLARSDRLGWAALACALDAALGRPDYSIDQTGWRPRVKTIRGPAKPGITGVLQAQHNLLVRLRNLPSLANLRVVVEAQHRLSADLAERVMPLDLVYAERWAGRAETYRLLQTGLENLAGRIGNGAHAAAEAANALTRLRAVPGTRVLEPRVLAGFEVLFERVDNRIADILHDGIHSGAYLQRTTTPELDSGGGQLVHPLRERVIPLTGAARSALIGLAETRLRTPPRTSGPPEPRRTRAQLAAALVHRPTTGGPAGGHAGPAPT